jgi:hypothetical protein
MRRHSTSCASGRGAQSVIELLLDEIAHHAFAFGKRAHPTCDIDRRDLAFRQPTKPIGPVYDVAEATPLAEMRGWTMGHLADGWRRVVALTSAAPGSGGAVIEMLTSQGVTGRLGRGNAKVIATLACSLRDCRGDQLSEMEVLDHVYAKLGVGEPTLPRRWRSSAARMPYPHPVGEVILRETHMSWVCLAGDRVYKLKKPCASHISTFQLCSSCRPRFRLLRALLGQGRPPRRFRGYRH